MGGILRAIRLGMAGTVRVESVGRSAKAVKLS